MTNPTEGITSMSAAESALEIQDPPDSLEELEQEPGEPEEVEPVEEASDDAADTEEVAAAEDEASSAEQQDGAGESDGQPRDERGRFAPKGEDAAPPESGPPPADHSPTGEPFHFRVDGYRVDVEGALEHDGRITIPRETWDRIVQPKLADRGRIQQQDERRIRRIRDLETEAEAREQRFKTVLGRVDELLGDPQKLRAFAENYATQAPLLKTQIELELERSKAKRVETERESSQKEAEEREFNELAPQGLANAVDVVLERLEAKAADRQAIVAELQGLWDMNVPVFFRVQEGDDSGLDPREHKWGVNLALVERIAKPHVALAQRSEAATKAAQVAKANAAKVGKAERPKAPPVAPAAGSPTPGGESKVPTTREEYEEYKKRRSAELNLPM